MKIAEWGMGGNRDQAMLAATPFLEMMGHLMCGRILLEQALIADQKYGDYYKNKVLTAKFFISEFMPKVHAIGKSIESGDESAFQIEF